MNIKIEHLGAIKSASVNLDKKITVFCGPNNTGKTYLSYVLYALRKFKKFSSINSEVTFSDNQTNKIFSGDKVDININTELVYEYRNSCIKNLIKNIDVVFGVSDEMKDKLFKNFHINFITTLEELEKKIKDIEFNNIYQLYELNFHIVKKKGENKVEVLPNKENNYETSFKHYFWDTKAEFIVLNYLLSGIYERIAFFPISDVVIFPVERNSIYTFNKELSLSRNMLIEKIQQLEKNKDINPFDFVEESSKRYSLAIRDGLYIANDLETIQKGKSKYYDIAVNIEKELLRGTVSVNKGGDVQFSPTRIEGNKKLPIHMSASIVKTLSSLILWLKHSANEDNLIIIDEPEMNLHPDNQILLTRIFVQLANEGLRFLISTHSDYIVREFNNLIMLGKYSNNLEDIGYKDNEKLNSNDIGVYYFNYPSTKRGANHVIVKPLDITDSGFDIPSVDDVIDKQNEIAANLYINLKTNK